MLVIEKVFYSLSYTFFSVCISRYHGLYISLTAFLKSFATFHIAYSHCCTPQRRNVSAVQLLALVYQTDTCVRMSAQLLNAVVIKVKQTFLGAVPAWEH